MADDQGEKTEDPTEHKLQEARKKGQVFKSKEVNQALEFAVIVMALVATGSWAARSLFLFTIGTYGKIAHLNFTSGDVNDLIYSAGLTLAKALLPILFAAAAGAFLFNAMQVGLMFSTEPLNPSLSKISPIEGFKRILSRKSIVELAKQLFKVVVIGTVAYKTMKGSLVQVINSPQIELTRAVFLAKHMALHLIWMVTLAYIIMAVIDYVLQRKFFMTQMMMSAQELKDEFKETEGDPQMKQRIRQSQRQSMEQSMAKQVPKASAVITNPVHLAVALQYELGAMEAPLVLAKGERLLAQRILEIAEEHEIPVLENVGLARALFEKSKVGSFIPGDLYKAVAEVLAFVYRLKKRKELAKKRAILRVREPIRRRHMKAGGTR